MYYNSIVREFVLSAFIFILSSAIVVLFYLLNVSFRLSQQTIIVLLVVLLIVLNALQLPSVRSFAVKRGKWYLLFVATLMVELFVYTTNGIYSPFLFLIYLYVIGTSFLYRPYVPLLFLLFFVLGLLAQILYDKDLYAIFQNDPGTAVLYGITLFSIVPLVQVLAQRYHLRESVSRVLSTQLKVEEAILSGLNELIFITDTNLRILSANDAVEITLHHSRTELFQKNIFSILFLRDTDNKLIGNHSIHLDKILTEKSVQTIHDATLLTSSSANKKVTLQVKPITDLEGNVDQISFIISDDTQAVDEDLMQLSNSLQIIQTKNTATFEEVKQHLKKPEFEQLRFRLMLLERSEEDVQTAQSLVANTNLDEKYSLIDLAKLGKHMLDMEQDFARAFGVPLQFALPNFGRKDIEPLITKDMQVSPQELTGPFFTSKCQVKYVTYILQKLTQISILLASTQLSPLVLISIERRGPAAIIAKISATTPPLTPVELDSVFIPNYGKLGNKTHLRFGSGLEGSLAKTLAHHLRLPFDAKIVPDEYHITFTLTLPREVKGTTV